MTTWTATPTFVAGQLLTAAVMEVLSDNLDALWAFTTAGDTIYATAGDELARLAIGADQKVLISDGSAPTWSTLAAQFMLSARGGTPSGTNGCSYAAQAELSTNKINLFGAGFDDTSQEYMEWTAVMPADYDGGTITAKFHWRAESANLDTVRWGLQGRGFADGDALDQAWGTAQEVSDDNQAENDLNISGATAAITLTGTPAAGQLVQFRAYRDPTHGDDDLVGDAILMYVEVSYTRATS